MGRKKGGINRKLLKEEKLKIIKRYLDGNLSQTKIAKQETISRGMLSNWLKKYIDEGEDSITNIQKTGNIFAALYTSKSLSEVDMLKLVIAKQEVEIECLKKGYSVKGVGAKKAFVTIKDVNTK